MATKRRPKCMNCHERNINRPRELCWRCYYLPGVREQYHVGNSKFARRGVAHFGGGTLPAPTKALPGSAEKVAELERRAEAGLALWHPMDGRETNERCAG